jgi:hypothetical protein
MEVFDYVSGFLNGGTVSVDGSKGVVIFKLTLCAALR